MENKTPITIEWLEEHGFKKLTGWQPVGCGNRYWLSLAKQEEIVVVIPNPLEDDNTEDDNTIAIEVSSSPDFFGSKPMHMCVFTKYCESHIDKKQYILDGNGEWIATPFYVEELFTLLKLTNNEDLIEFFK